MPQSQQTYFLKLFVSDSLINECYLFYSWLESLDKKWSKENGAFKEEVWNQQTWSREFRFDILGGTIKNLDFYLNKDINEKFNKENLRFFLWRARSSFKEHQSSCRYDKGVLNLTRSFRLYTERKVRIQKEKIGVAVWRVWYEDLPQEKKPMWLKTKCEHLRVPKDKLLSVLPKNIVKMILKFVDPEIFQVKTIQFK